MYTKTQDKISLLCDSSMRDVEQNYFSNSIRTPEVNLVEYVLRDRWRINKGGVRKGESHYLVYVLLPVDLYIGRRKQRVADESLSCPFDESVPIETAPTMELRS